MPAYSTTDPRYLQQMYQQQQQAAQQREQQRQAATSFQDRDLIMQHIMNGLGSSAGRPAPTAGPVQTGNAATIATGPQDQFRGMQMQQANALMAQALGTQKGPGQIAAEQNTARAMGGQHAMARMARGGNAGVMGLNAARGAADIGQVGVGQAAQAGMQDKNNANAMLSQVLGSGRGADIGLATSQAGMNQQMTMANMDAQNRASLADLDAQLRQTGMNDAQVNAFLGSLIGMNQSEMMARVQELMNRQNQPDMFGQILSAGAQIIPHL